MNRAEDPQVEHGARWIGGADGRAIPGHAAKVVEEGKPVGGIKRGEEVGDGLSQLVLDVGRINAGAVGSKALVDIAHQIVFYVNQTWLIQTLCLDGIVDYLQTDMADDLIWRGRTCEKGKADLPARRIFSELIQEGVGLSLEILVGLGVEGDLDGALDLSSKYQTFVVDKQPSMPVSGEYYLRIHTRRSRLVAWVHRNYQLSYGSGLDRDNFIQRTTSSCLVMVRGRVR